ncbi:MAG: protein-L-isoaspartate(D-aspartate) O-methyltransferase [Gammaproteobacteria bacterium]
MDESTDTFARLREIMIRQHVAARGIRNERVLNALQAVPREAFVPDKLREFAYEDSPLPIAEGQTISQPYIVALMIDALDLHGGENVLEIGAGSGYAAAVLAQIADRVTAVERLEPLAAQAGARLADLGIDNAHIVHGDGTKGWPEHAPYDAIVVAAGGPAVPEALKAQLKIGGRLVIPIGTDPRVQELVRIVRHSRDQYVTQDIADVRFVPLIGAEGWSEPGTPHITRAAAASAARPALSVADTIKQYAEPFTSLETCDLAPLLERIGDRRIVLIGEASHGTSEFYRLRARLTQQLIEERGFSFVAIEGDWPDAARIDHYVRHFDTPPAEWVAFARFPTWMWRNREVREFVDWLRLHNTERHADQRTAFYGLDLYSLYSSIRAILAYRDAVDPKTAAVARHRYACLTPWQSDPTAYSHAALTGHYRKCEKDVLAILSDIIERRGNYMKHDGERYLDAVQNARLIANAERYYRTMYYGSRVSWNLRDNHMFETLDTLLKFHGPHSKAVVWAHNSHVGDAAATEMSARGEHNLGRLSRDAYGGDAVYIVGFGTDTGTVAAASAWDGPLEIKSLRPALDGSVEHNCHRFGPDNFLLPLQDLRAMGADCELNRPRLERAIGVIYQPQTELQSHYFEAVVPHQFDEYIWFDRSAAVEPIATRELEGLPDTYPFGL